MAQTGKTPILLYHSTVASAVPSNANLQAGELAMNIADMKLYTENSGGTVTLLASADAAAGNFTTVDTTNLEVTNIKAKDGTAAIVITDSTGAVTVSSPFATTGNTTLGNASGDTVTVTGTITSNLIFTDNTYDIGASGATRPRNLFLSNDATIGGAVGTLGNITITKAEPTVVFSNTGNDSWLIAAGGGGNVSNGYFGIRNTTDGVTPFQIAPDAVGSTLVLTSTGVSITGGVTYSSGTANGVLYLNGSKVATSSASFTNDGTTLLYGTLTASTYANMALYGPSTANYGPLFFLNHGGTDILKFANYGRIQGGTSADAFITTGTTNSLLFGINNTERMRIDSSGNVGIGTASPGAKLDVSGDIKSTSNILASLAAAQVGLTNATYGSAYHNAALSYPEVHVRPNSGYAGAISFTENLIADRWSIGIKPADSNLYFFNVRNITSATAVMTINSLGYLGVASTPQTYAAIEYAETTAVSGGSLYGIELTPSLSAGTTVIEGVRSRVRASTGTHTSVVAVRAGLDGFAAGSTITTGYGLRVTKPTGAATTLYGVASEIDAASGYWNIYASGTAQNYFAGNVGIGIAGPGYKLQVSNGTESILLSPTTGANYIGSASNTTLVFTINALEKMRLDTSGNLGIGTNSPAYSLDIGSSTGTVDLSTVGVRIRRNGVASGWGFINNVAGALNLDQYESTSPAARFRTSTDGSTFVEQLRITHTASAVNYLTLTGSSTTNPTELKNAGTDAAIGMYITSKGSSSIQFHTGGTSSAYSGVAQVIVGHTASANRYITLTGSNGGNPTISTSAGALALGNGQLQFPATQNPSSDANTLDDYEEGTWTPAVTSITGTITTVGAVAGTYTKIGRLVTVSADVTITTNGTGASGIFINGLPFIGSQTVVTYYAISGYDRNGIALAGEYNPGTGGFGRIAFYKYDGTYPGADGKRFIISLSYET